MSSFHQGNNPDLFYDKQISTDSLCWVLKAPNGAVLRGILPDMELSYTITNRYDAHSDYDIIAGVMRGTVQKTARQLYTMGSVAENLANKAAQLTGDLVGSVSETAGDAVEGAMNTATEFTVDMAKRSEGISDEILNVISPGLKTQDLAYGEFVSAFDHAKFWEGTTNAIGIPTLTTILFDEDTQSLKSKLASLHDLVCGTMTDGEGDDLSGMWAIQRAPHGYKPLFNPGQLSDPNFEGVFTLKLGDRCTIRNLVVTNLQVNLSQVKRLGSENSPLYASLQIQVEPAGYVSKKALNSYLQL